VSSARRSVLLTVAALVAAGVSPLSAPPVAASVPSLPSGCAQAAHQGVVTCTFAFTGDVQSFTVPVGVTSVGLHAWGGHGGEGKVVSVITAGGRGADVSGVFPVQGGDVLTVTVGGDASGPTGAFGYGSGGTSSNPSFGRGGGGGSAIVDGATLLLVAGAGGGAGLFRNVCPGPGVGGDAGSDGGSSAPCGQSPGAVGGRAGASLTQDGDDSVADIGLGGGGGGGGYRGGGGGQDSPLSGPASCCASAAGGGGGTSHADASGTNVDLGSLSDRTLGTGGLVQISYQPQGPITQLGLSPDSGSINAGTEQPYAVSGHNAEGAFVSDLSGTATLSIAPDGSCSASGCTPVGVGPHVVTAEYAGLSTTATLDVTAPPAFTSADDLILRHLESHPFTITTTGTPVPSLALAGTPPLGMTFTDNGDGTATLGGAPFEDGTHDLAITASNSVGQATQVLHVLVGDPPLYTAPQRAMFVHGRPGSFNAVFAAVPLATISLDPGSKLPAGLTFVDNGTSTATIAGTPTGRPVARQVSLTATNPIASTTQTLTVVVKPASGSCANPQRGSAGHDRLRGTPRGDRLTGLAGNDTLLGYAGSDCLSGGAGRDVLFGDHGDDQVSGGSGNDHLVGGPGRDVLRGGAGDDTIRAVDGQRDVVICGPGHDTVVADHRDVLQGCGRAKIL
jgi:Ca2+-binding RTX toxin-like protein